jgi:hypothetical protein
MTEKELNELGIFIESDLRGQWSVNVHGTWLFASRRWFTARAAAVAYAIEIAETEGVTAGTF